MTLWTLFTAFDEDASDAVDYNEFRQMFAKLGLMERADASELREIFDSVDADGSGTIEWIELKRDF